MTIVCIVTSACTEIAFSVVASPMMRAGSCLLERNGESDRSEIQDSEFGDLRRHFAEFVACKEFDVDDLVV